MLYNRTLVSINKYEVATLATDVEKEREREGKKGERGRDLLMGVLHPPTSPHYRWDSGVAPPFKKLSPPEALKAMVSA